MASIFYTIPVLLVVVGIMSYMAEKRLMTEGDNSSTMTKLLGGSIFQVVFIMVLTTYFLSTFFFPNFS
jgi:uncharacterized membrane protein YidH (DUF202 family)